MNGIEILSSQEVVTQFAFNWTAFSIAGTVIMCLSVIVGIINWYDTCDWICFLVFILFGIFATALFGTIAGNIAQIPTEYETQYKVLISDEVSMNDFNAKYEIVDQEGKIYTIRERN